MVQHKGIMVQAASFGDRVGFWTFGGGLIYHDKERVVALAVCVRGVTGYTPRQTILLYVMCDNILEHFSKFFPVESGVSPSGGSAAQRRRGDVGVAPEGGSGFLKQNNQKTQRGESGERKLEIPFTPMSWGRPPRRGRGVREMRCTCREDAPSPGRGGGGGRGGEKEGGGERGGEREGEIHQKRP